MNDLDLTHEEVLLGETVRGYLADFVDNPYLNEQEAALDGYEAARWKELAALGLATVNLPERVGGGGGSLAEAAVVARECGRAAFASPMLQTTRAGTVLAAIGSNSQVDSLLEAIVEGRPAALVAPADRTMRAHVATSGHRLAGDVTVVEWLAQCEYAVFLVPTTDGAEWICAAVPRQDMATRVTVVPSTDNEHVALLDPEGLTLDEQSIVARVPSQQAHHALARANLLRASSMVGGAEAVLAMTVEYARQREQFGQPIGAFQAVRHHVARMAIAVDAARLTCNDALARDAGEEDPADLTAVAAMALFVAGRSYVDVVLTAAQVHGAIGTTTEHILHHHFRRAKSMQLRTGKRANRLREIHETVVIRGDGSLW